jgi:uncharacterized protein (DUF302 family)
LLAKGPTVNKSIEIEARNVRHIKIRTGREYEEFRAQYEIAVPHFDRLEAIGVVMSGSGWEAIQRLSAATASHGFVNFFTFDPSPVMKLNGNTGRGVTYLAGNIVEAERGFRIDPSCFLYIPLRVAIIEGLDGHALLSFDHPTDLFAVFGDADLESVGFGFSELWAQLLEHLDLPIPEGFTGRAGVSGRD